MKQTLGEHINLFERVICLEPQLRAAASHCAQSIQLGGKIMFVGNGGSASDAQHLAAELVGRFVKNRRALPGLALSTDTSALTCIGNDFGFEDVFARQVEGLGRHGDVLVAISTSGSSKNVIRAVEVAKQSGIFSIGFLGRDGGALGNLVNLPLIIEHPATARIQEAHIFLGHELCRLIEVELGI